MPGAGERFCQTNPISCNFLAINHMPTRLDRSSARLASIGNHTRPRTFYYVGDGT